MASAKRKNKRGTLLITRARWQPRSAKHHVTPALIERKRARRGEARRGETKRTETKRNETNRHGKGSPENNRKPRRRQKEQHGSPTTPSVSRVCLGSRPTREGFVPAWSPSPGSTWCSAIAHRGSTQEKGKGAKRATTRGSGGSREAETWCLAF